MNIYAANKILPKYKKQLIVWGEKYINQHIELEVLKLLSQKLIKKNKQTKSKKDIAQNNASKNQTIRCCKITTNLVV